MTAPDSAVVFNGDGTVTIAGKRYTLDPLSFNHRKQKPPTWTDPDTDITYDTSTGEPV
jgi:hypothetical protein